MRRTAATAGLLFLVACMGREAPRPLFESRVPYEPLLKKLEASGGDAAKVVVLRSASDLGRLDSGERYKFVVRPDGTMAVAPLPVETPGNEYVHPVLGEGKPVRTAGNIRVVRGTAGLSSVTVDQDSKAYCPTGDSLTAALESLARLGVPAGLLRVENRPAECAEPGQAIAMGGGAGSPKGGEEGERYGALMAEVGSRFERLGRAFEAGRYELAEFERGEMAEVFEEDLPRAEPPRENTGVDLDGVADAFRQTSLPELEAALVSRNRAAFRQAYARAAETCNGCHRSSGHGFVEIPTVPGQAVPRLDPVR
jgi:hypothetical protein